MFPIYLLEDDSKQRANFAAIIKNTIMIHDLAMGLICETDNSQTLMNFVDQTHQGLFFLDMQIGKQKDEGLSTAMKIREQIVGAQIVFITTHDELSILTLERKVSL